MSINLNVQGNTQPLEAAVNAAINRIRKTPIKITVDDKGATQPLGNMKRGADEFSKSMEAANSRIIAFGASMAIINGVADGFKALVKNVVEVEKALADINVVMNLSTTNLEKFSNGLFKTAKETGAAFNVAAEAATEYARQGLTMEESLKRTRDALILTRLTGMDSANAVKALTAAMNTYGDQIKDTTQLVSKFAAVDVKFAVSAEDFADAISRTGQAARSAGVDIDELVGLVTAAQQKTARGGKVIGNSFKTIFTRIGRTDTLNQLENLGIAVRDLEGNTIGARRILTDLANTFDHLTESQKAQIAQTVGGVFQINILKAVLSDAAKQNGILANATQISAGATTEAIDKNDQLRQTMSAMATETGIALKELSAQIGEIMLAPGMEKVLNVFKGLAEGANEMLGGGESTGSDFAQGFLKGLGNIITGPGLVIISAVFIKLFAKALVYANQSLRSLIGVTSEAHKQKAIQTSLVTLFGQNAAISKEMLRTDISRTEKEKIILGLLKAQVVEANMLNSVSKSVAGGLYTRGYNANLAPRKGRAGGHIPNFADPEREQAARGGYAAGTIRSMNMPGEGSVIYNSAEKVKNFKGMSQPAIMPPHSSKAGKNYQQAFGDVHGFDPYAAGGYIPNYARKDSINEFLMNKSFTTLASVPRGDTFESLSAGNKNKATVAYTSLMSYVDKNQANLPPRQLIQAYRGDTVRQDPKRSLAAMLVPPEGYKKPFANHKDLTWPVYGLRPDAQTDPSLSEEVKKDFMKTGSEYGNKVASVLNKAGQGIDGDKIWNRMKKTAGAMGAWQAAVGSLFETAVSTALGYEADEKGNEQGDFDVRGGGEKAILSKAFEGFPENMVLADFKNDSESYGNKESFYKKVMKEKRFEKMQNKNKLIQNPKRKAYGHIPNFAAARIALTGGLVKKNKFGNIDRKQMTRLVRSNPYFNGLMNEHLTWDSFPKKDKRKLSGWLLKQGVSNRALQAYGLASMHSKSIGEGISDLAMARGHIPNFANPLSDAIGREKAAGVPVSQIRVDSHPALMGKSNPIGLGVTNTYDEPNGLKDVFGAADGYVPNYAEPGFQRTDVDKISGVKQGRRNQDKLVEKLNRRLEAYIDKFKSGEINQKKLNDGIARLSKRTKDQAASSNRITRETNEGITLLQRLNAARLRATKSVGSAASSVSNGAKGAMGLWGKGNSWMEKTSLGKGLSSTGGQMGLMMGAPMLAGMLQGDGIGTVSDTSYKAGGVAQGLGTGAAMGMMFGPLGTVVGGTIGAFKGLMDASDELKEAQKEAVKVARESSVQTGAALGQSLAPALAKTDFGKGGAVNFSFAGKQRELDLDSPNQLSAKNVEMGRFGMKMGEDLRKQMMSGIDVSKLIDDSNGRFTKLSENLSKSGLKGTVIDKEFLKNSLYSSYDSDSEYGEAVGRDKQEQIKMIEDQILAQMGSAARPEAIKAALDQLPADMKIQTAALKEGSTAGGRDFKKGALEYFTPEELKRQIDEGDITQVAKAYEDILKQIDTQKEVNAENNKAVILQLNAQRAMVAAQQETRDIQFNIKSSYAEISSSLSLQAKIMGSSATEQQKAMQTYTKSILKAAESYNKAGTTERGKYREKMINLSNDKGIASSLKISLAKKKMASGEMRWEKPGGGKAPKGEVATGKTLIALSDKIELTEEFIKLSNEELYVELAKANLSPVQLQTLEDYKSAKVKNIELLVKELNLSNSIAESEFKINDAIGRRKDIVSSMKGASSIVEQSIKSRQESRNSKASVDAARRLTAFGPGFKTGKEQEAFQMNEKTIALENKIKKIREDSSIEMSNQQAALAAILLEESRISELRDKDKLHSEGEGKKLTDDERTDLDSLLKIDEKRTVEKIKLEMAITRSSSKLKEDIGDAETILALEKERLENKRKHETGPGAFGRGARGAQKKIVEQAETMEHRLGDQLTHQFRDGLVDGMQAAINKADDLSDVMNNIAMNFLGAIQQAYLGKAADAIVGALPFSSGGGVRKYSKGGGVPAMVTDGEYVMGRDAVKKYGGGFMHRLNAGGKLPGYSNGGKPDETQPGSALAANFGGGEGYNTGRRYQTQAMSGFFYSGQSGNLGLQEDTQYTKGIIQERMRKEAEKKAKKRALMQMVVGTALSVGMSAGIGAITSGAINSGGGLTGTAKAAGYTGATPAGTTMGFDSSGSAISVAPGSDMGGYMNTAPTRSWNPFSWGSTNVDNDFLNNYGSSNFQPAPSYGGGKPWWQQGQAAYFGGRIGRYATGGHVSGKSGIDQIPAMLSEGEYVVRASSARQLGKPMLDRINAGKFNDGGAVTPLTESSETGTSGGNTNNINITVNMDKGSGKSEKKDDKGGANPKDSSADQEKSSQLAEKVKQQVISVIMDEKRPGGLLSD